jgi:hypothetical protein
VIKVIGGQPVASTRSSNPMPAWPVRFAADGWMEITTVTAGGLL